MTTPVQEVIKSAARIEELVEADAIEANGDQAPEEPEVDILKESFMVDLIDPVTVDGVTYTEIEFDFPGQITPEDITKYEKQYQQITGNRLDSTEIADRIFQEFFLRKASGLGLGVFRGLGARDKRAVYNLAMEYLGKISYRTKRRKKPSSNSSLHLQ
jgi:hypothetical protein